MSVNLTKNQNELLKAYRNVVDDKSDINWALFGYEKQSNVLQVVGVGSDGLEELSEEFNCGKIMYAFCKVIDPKTELAKYVFINWQGEGAPLPLKGTCASHVRDVSNLFKGAHISINARTEDDVDPAVITEKVGKTSASKFNFKERSDPVENLAPVGSVYKRIQPTREINHSEREKFWEKEQQDEKTRQVSEKKKSEEAKKKFELERKEREIVEATARDQAVKERTKSITQLKEAERLANSASRNQEQEKVLWEKQLEEDARMEKERRKQSEMLRRERCHDAQAVISKRTINAHAIFEQNTCAGQLSRTERSNSINSKVLQQFENDISPNEEPIKTVVMSNDIIKEEPKIDLCNEIKIQSPEKKTSPVDFPYTRNLLKDLQVTQDSMAESIPDELQNWDEPILEAMPDVCDPLAEMLVECKKEDVIQEPSPKNTNVERAPPLGSCSQATQGLTAKALYDYQAADDTEISFDPDDLITQIEQIDEGWWQGLGPDGTYGLFPANYVELLN